MDIELVAREVVDSAMKVHTVLGPDFSRARTRHALFMSSEARIEGSE